MKAGRRGWWLGALFFVSGIPGLMAQAAWIRIFGAGLGHEFPALMGVVSGYFAGLALGGFWAGRYSDGWRRPARVYGLLELGSALWITLTTLLLGALIDAVRVWSGLESIVVGKGLAVFVAPWVVIVPSAMALGATLPAMERAVQTIELGKWGVGGLYGLNTGGAVLGVALAVGWVMPNLGFRGTLFLSAAIQVICGLMACGLTRNDAERPSSRCEAVSGRPRVSPLLAYGMSAMSGLLGMGYQFLAVRALANVTENTVHTYGMALGSVLIGTSLGGFLSGRLRWLSDGVVAGSLGVVCALEIGLLRGASALLERARPSLGRLGSEATLSAVVFGIPCVLMGILFSRWVTRAGERAGGVGVAVGWNCVGGAMAGLLILAWALPALGLKWAILVVATGYGAMAWASGRPAGHAVVPLGVIAGVAVISGPLRLLEIPAGATVVREVEGRLASVAVLRTSDGERVLRVNNHFQQGGTASAGAARRHAHIPLLLHANPESVLFLGVGTGITMGAAADHPGLRVVGVELLSEVVSMMAEFEPENGAPGRREGFRVIQADARRFVRTTADRFDVIIADLFHPAEDGAGFLYTREHFEAIRERLQPGGLFCQWLPLHQMDLGTFRDVGRTFREIFPDASLWLLRFNVDVPVIGLVGGDGRIEVEPDRVSQRMSHPRRMAALKSVALADPVRLLGCRIAGEKSLGQLVTDGTVATDDRPTVLYRAAASAYGLQESPGERLRTILAGGEPEFDGVVKGGEAVRWIGRLEAFRRARDLHLGGLVKETSGRRAEALEDYLASAAESSEYTAGYAQAVVVASAYVRENPEMARSVLERLIRVRPEQSLAVEMLQRMKGPGESP